MKLFRFEVHAPGQNHGLRNPGSSRPLVVVARNHGWENRLSHPGAFTLLAGGGGGWRKVSVGSGVIRCGLPSGVGTKIIITSPELPYPEAARQQGRHGVADSAETTATAGRSPYNFDGRPVERPLHKVWDRTSRSAPSCRGPRYY